MSASQLRLAYTAVVRCASGSDDALAWYCILQLVDAIKDIPPGQLAVTPAAASSTPSPSSPNSSNASEATSSSPREFDDEAVQTRLDEAASLSDSERQALTLRRGHVLLALIDQTTSCNLVLLRKLLYQIWSFVRQERSCEMEELPQPQPRQGQQDGQGSAVDALVRVLFSTLGEGLDATKREEGVRFWLERSEELAVPLRSLSGTPEAENSSPSRNDLVETIGSPTVVSR